MFRFSGNKVASIRIHEQCKIFVEQKSFEKDLLQQYKLGELMETKCCLTKNVVKS